LSEKEFTTTLLLRGRLRTGNKSHRNSIGSTRTKTKFTGTLSNVESIGLAISALI
jgi:hypothetical protein